jgi:hypothetical protein
MVVVEVVHPVPKMAGVALGEVRPRGAMPEIDADQSGREAEERLSGGDSISRAIVIPIRRQ